MKTIVPDYYRDFACIAGKCRHSCCIGWEIDIDEDSLARFKRVPGDIGARLKANICEDDTGAHFVLGAGERCPFLNGEGLCDLIIALGEDCLCQICADHPRFRNFFSDREEIGLGLCCEAAGKLILFRKEAAKLIVEDDDGETEALDEDEEILLQLRSEAIAAMQNRSLPLAARVSDMLQLMNMPDLFFFMPDWADFLLGLERLDERWPDMLLAIRGVPALPLPCLPEMEIPFEQLAVYLLTRHLPGALEDGDITGRTAFVLLMLHLANALCAAQGDAFSMDVFIEAARMLSSEIEYSDENIYAILDELHVRFPEL